MLLQVEQEAWGGFTTAQRAYLQSLEFIHVGSFINTVSVEGGSMDMEETNGDYLPASVAGGAVTQPISGG